MRGLLLIAAWLSLHAPLLAWFGRTFSHTSFRLNALLLVAAVGLLAWRVSRAPRLGLSRVPSRNGRALAVLLTAGALGLACRRFVGAEMLEAPLFLLGTWGLLGLFVDAVAWRRALVPTLVFVSVLPFGAQADAYAGFMARVFSARAAAALLAAAGAPSLSAETVLVFENGVAQIDAPCSGLRSLWMGAVVFLLALWVEGRRLSLRTLGALALLLAMLLGANVARVSLIVLLAVVLEQPALAEVVHVPIGLVGFLVATGTALLLLRASGARAAGRAAAPVARPALGAPALLAISGLCLLGALASSARPSHAARPHSLELELPEAWQTERLSLTAAEEDLLARFAEGRVAKLLTHPEGGRAAVLLVESASWRSHHPPELCLAGAGHQLSEVSEREVAPGLRVRFARMDGGPRFHVSWFQAGATTHADLVDRILAQWLGADRAFVMVSVVAEGFSGLEDPSFRTFLTELRARVAERSEEDPS